MLRVPPCGEVASQPHRYRAGRHLGESRRYDDVRLAECATKSSSEREGNRQSIRHPDDDIADDIACSEVFLSVDMCLHGSRLKHVL